MNRGLLLILAACTLAAAMAPRDRRAVNTEEEEERLRTESTTEKPKEICAQQTPCKWSMYKPVLKYIEMNITNTYCICDVGMECQMTEDDTSVNAYVFRCRVPVEAEDTTEES